jgi:fructokinase
MRLGIDLGGTKTEIIALDGTGAEIYRKRVDTDTRSYETVLATITGLVKEAEAVLGEQGTVGVGIPGAISGRTGLVKNANTNALNGHPLDKNLGQTLKREVRCSNDANCLALSEAVDGAAKARRVVFAAILGTGCGAGMSNVDELYELVPPQLASYVFGSEAMTPIVRSMHGDSSGVRGAAWLWNRE